MATAQSPHQPQSDGAPIVAIVDADRRVRQSLSDLLSLAGLPVAGAAGTAGEALRLVERTHPSIVLVDPRLPDVNAGEALLAALAVLDPTVRVVLMGWYDPLELPALLERAAAYVPKGSSPEEFVAAALAACGCVQA